MKAIYTANYGNGNFLKLEAKTEVQAKKEATKRGCYGQDIDLLEGEYHDGYICIASKEYGKKWRNQNI